MTYFDTINTSHVYDLKRHTHQLRQADGLIETYNNNLQGLCQEIYFRCPNRIKCASYIQECNNILQEDHVYILLDGLDDWIDKALLYMTLFSTIEQACVYARCEDLRQAMMMGIQASIVASLAAKGT